MTMKGEQIYKLMEKLFPICRSITGDGVRESLKILKEVCPILKTYEIPSGTKVFDWVIPKEWNIRDAYVEDQEGKRVIDFRENNLHVVGYSLPMNEVLSLSELKEITHTYPKLPDAIPYVTSYYKETSGFCMSQNEMDKLREGNYHVVIDSELKEGSLTYGEILIPGKSEREILFSTYVCHPSMANNELSGPCVAAYLAEYLLNKEHEYTYRFVFVPETIGSIAYISKNLEELKDKVIAGYNLSCLGDDKTYTCVSTRYGNTLSDRVAEVILKYRFPEYNRYSFLNRGSDERQYNMPGVDIPICGIYRSKSNEYDQYHTSLDNMDFVSADALGDSFEFLLELVFVLEHNAIYKNLCLCEPQLGKRGLYPKTSRRGSSKVEGHFKTIDFLAYADGTNDLIAIANIIGLTFKNTFNIAKKLENTGLIEKLR
ncbi:MAG: DUF4910 domain-containing protein [Ruminococcus flavefaciens]|nr:DUF4910 domain-containing protein [Ruminococcus flavefaciens]